MESTNTLFNLAGDLIAYKELRRAHEATVDEYKKKIANTENQMIELMVQDEIQNFKMNGQTFYLGNKLFASIPEENQEVVIALFKQHEHFSGLVKETINAKTLAAWVKERREEGDMPEAIEEKLNIYEKTTIGVRKS